MVLFRLYNNYVLMKFPADIDECASGPCIDPRIFFDLVAGYDCRCPEELKGKTVNVRIPQYLKTFKPLLFNNLHTLYILDHVY